LKEGEKKTKRGCCTRTTQSVSSLRRPPSPSVTVAAHDSHPWRSSSAHLSPGRLSSRTCKRLLQGLDPLASVDLGSFSSSRPNGQPPRSRKEEIEGQSDLAAVDMDVRFGPEEQIVWPASVLAGILMCAAVYDITREVSSRCYKGYNGLNELHKLEWNNR
jgi:hypothetical protein